MKFNVLKKDFYQKLTLVSYVLTGRISVYENVTFIADDGITLYGTDGNISVFAKVGGKVDVPGIISVNGQRLKEIVNTYPNEPIIFSAEKDVLNITCGGFQNVLFKAMDNVIPNISTEGYVEVPLVNKISKLSWAEYIHFTDNVFVGINDVKHRTQMGQVTETGLVTDIVVPKGILMLVERLDNQPCDVSINKNTITIKQNDYCILGGIQEPIPFDYSGIIPKKLTNYITIPDKLVAALTNAGKYNIEVIISFRDGEINVRASNDKSGGADITLNGKGKGSGAFKIYAKDLIGAIGRTGNVLGVTENGIVALLSEDYSEVIAPIKR